MKATGAGPRYHSPACSFGHLEGAPSYVLEFQPLCANSLTDSFTLFLHAFHDSFLLYDAQIWRIWPAVLLHTLFAAGVVTLSLKGILRLEIPNIMLTVLGAPILTPPEQQN